MRVRWDDIVARRKRYSAEDIVRKLRWAGSNTTVGWGNLLKGESGIAFEEFQLSTDQRDVLTLPVGRVRLDDGLLGSDGEARLARFQQLALIAAREAISDAGLANADLSSVGVFCGTSLGGIADIPSYFDPRKQGWRSLDRLAPQKLLCHTGASVVAEILGARGSLLTVGTACAAGSDAIRLGYEALRLGTLDQVLIIGTESWLTGMGLDSFRGLGAVTRGRRLDARQSSRPFDAERDGLVPAEGAGALILERHPRREGSAYCALIGAASTSDSYHPFAPNPQGTHAVEAFRLALSRGGTDAKHISHVNAHGTSTRANDKVESRVIHEVLGTRAAEVPVTALKSQLGHTIGASGVIESAYVAKAIAERLLPPTINLTDQDSDNPLNIPTQSIPYPTGITAKLSFGFGGHNTVLLFGAV